MAPGGVIVEAGTQDFARVIICGEDEILELRRATTGGVRSRAARVRRCRRIASGDAVWVPGMGGSAEPESATRQIGSAPRGNV